MFQTAEPGKILSLEVNLLMSKMEILRGQVWRETSVQRPIACLCYCLSAVGTDCVSVYCVSAVGRGSNHRVALPASRPVGDRELREKEELKLGTLSPQATGEITNT